MQSSVPTLQQEMLRRRLPAVIIVLLVASSILVIRMILFQAPQDPRVASYVQQIREANQFTTERQTSPRGTIYDRNGQPLAVNTLQYRIGISPNIISDRESAVQQLSIILDRDPLEISQLLNPNRTYALLATDVDPETWRQIDDLDFLSSSIRPETIPRRYYPQSIAGPLLGIVAGDGNGVRGYNGIEGYYEAELAGRVRDQEISRIPFDLPEEESSMLERGADLVLTLDSDIQFLVEETLANAVQTTGAGGGTIIVMNPKNGDILAMASYPTFDPNRPPFDNQQALRNPAISEVYEPGSVFKILTVAAGLDEGVITQDWTYFDNGLKEVGSKQIQNWDDRAYGVVDVTSLLVNSLNVGAATVAVDELGKDAFYRRVAAFGIGQRTGVDLEGEERGILRFPGDELWSESDLGTNSYGQGVATTPLQMLNATNVIANGGLLIQPRIVSQIVRGTDVVNLDPVVVRRVISPETARTVSEMMVAVVNEGVDDAAGLSGYTIAGKTGTAQIPTPTGFELNRFKMTFVGFLPADDPQISILVKLDRPTSGQFASQTAAPVFRRLVEQLVLVFEIPNDALRFQIAAEGGVIGGIDR